jgi:hypothetical protein
MQIQKQLSCWKPTLAAAAAGSPLIFFEMYQMLLGSLFWNLSFLLLE